MESFFHQTSLNDSIRSINKEKPNKSTINEKTLRSQLRNQKLERELNFKSLNELKESVEKNYSKALKQIFEELTFVGCLDRELALIQYQTGLYVLNTRILSEELFYQICLFNFGNFGYFKLEEPVDLECLLLMALNDPRTGWSDEDGPKERLSKRCAKFLSSKGTMLDDFFLLKLKKSPVNNQVKQNII